MLFVAFYAGAALMCFCLLAGGNRSTRFPPLQAALFALVWPYVVIVGLT